MTSATELRPTNQPFGGEQSDPDKEGGLARQWLGLLLAPAVFFVHLEAAYLLVPWACRTGGTIWLHVAGAGAVILAAVGALMAWLAFGQAGRAPPGDGHGSVPRARLMAIAGLATSALFVLVIAAQWVSEFVIPPCE